MSTMAAAEWATKLSLRKFTDDPSSWLGASFLSASQVTPSGLKLVFERAREMRQLVRGPGGDERLKHKILGSVFFEASTRTACSFEASSTRLGGAFIHLDGKGNSSAGKKGESLQDTMRTLESYCDIVILRHPIEGSVGKVVEVASKPVINAGDGVGEHPTQSLQDVFTIHDELKLSDTADRPLTVVMLGDLKHGRTVHSLAKLLPASGMWKDSLTLRYCAPPGLGMPAYIQEAVKEMDKVKQEEVDDLAKAIEGADVLYVTRIQRERFETDADYEKVKGSYVVDKALMAKASPSMVVMHPLPRVDEISTEIDQDPRSAYFRQMENGMFVRMTLLSLILGK